MYSIVVNSNTKLATTKKPTATKNLKYSNSNKKQNKNAFIVIRNKLCLATSYELLTTNILFNYFVATNRC